MYLNRIYLSNTCKPISLVFGLGKLAGYKSKIVKAGKPPSLFMQYQTFLGGKLKATALCSK